MEFTNELYKAGFELKDVDENDIEAFVFAEKESHFKYVSEYSWFFGEWNEDVLMNAFYSKVSFTYFKKVILNNEIVGFLSYDEKDCLIDNIFIRLISKAQNQGIGTLFLSMIKEKSEELHIPAELVVIKNNPAQNLYKKLGFQEYKEDRVFYYLRYAHS